MIFSLKDLRRYQQEDLAAHGLSRWRWTDRFRYPVLAFQRKLRRTEYILNRFEGNIWRLYCQYSRRSLRTAGMKLGFTISANIFGPGLSIAHWGTIVVNPECRVGARCRIHPGVCLGWHNGQVPVIGDDCYLGPGAKIYGGVVLGDSTKVGANAVVSRSYPDGGAILVAPREQNVQKQPLTWARQEESSAFPNQRGTMREVPFEQA
jgi:serine O-acetyltransferase